MPRFYFHLSAAGEEFRDEIGCEVSDLVAAHARAERLANRIIMFSALSGSATDLRRSLVKVTDQRQNPVPKVDD